MRHRLRRAGMFVVHDDGAIAGVRQQVALELAVLAGQRIQVAQQAVHRHQPYRGASTWRGRTRSARHLGDHAQRPRDYARPREPLALVLGAAAQDLVRGAT